MSIEKLRNKIKDKEQKKIEEGKEKYEKEILFELSQDKNIENNFFDRLVYGTALFFKKIGKLGQFMDLSFSFEKWIKILGEKIAETTKLDNDKKVIFNLTMAEYVGMLSFCALIASMIIIPVLMILILLKS
jgi:hypothetical protein